MPMDIRFDIFSGDETGGFVARWDDPAGGGICTQGESIADLEAMVREAVEATLPSVESPCASSFISSRSACLGMKLPRDVNGKEVAKASRRPGFAEMRQTGSHRFMRKEGRSVVVPLHRPIKTGTLKGLIEQAGIRPEEFAAAL